MHEKVTSSTVTFFYVHLGMIYTIDLHFQQLEGAIAAFLIPTDDGLVLVETGPSSTLSTLRTEIARLGFSISDIKVVLLTHIHLDHAGAAWYFADQGSTIYVHQKGYRHLNDPEILLESATRIYGDKMDQLWGQMAPISKDRLIGIEREDPIEIGGKIFNPLLTPGHAKHHIAWHYDDVIFSGDVGGVKIGSGPVMPPCPPPDINIELWLRSIEAIRELGPKKLYLTHFGQVTTVTQHLNELESRLLEWSQWIKPFWEEGVPITEVVEKFTLFVRTSLLSAGLNESQVSQYEAANPSGMSVYGLFRYWEKRMNN